MTARAWVIGAALLTSGCGWFAPDCGIYEPQPPESVALGVDADLHGLEAIDLWVGGERHYQYLATGSGGTVVVWGQDHDDRANFAELYTVGDVDLRGAWVDEWIWWVVGDAGMIAVSNDRGDSWTTLALPNNDADLGAGGELFDIQSDGALTLVDALPGSRALAHIGYSHLATVGDGGTATRMATSPCG